MFGCTFESLDMGQLPVLPDVVAVAADRLVVVVRVEDDGTVVVRDLANGRQRTTSASELSAPPFEAGPGTSLGSISRATEAQWDRARRREAVLAGIAHAPDIVEQVDQAATRLGVSRRTLFRWLARYRDAPQTSTLLPQARGTPAGAHRLDRRVEDLIASAIKDVYLTKVRASKEEVVRQVLLRCQALGLSAPSRNSVLARIRALDPRSCDKARLQPKEADARHTPVPGIYRVDRALDVVQIDHTRVDVVVVDESQRLPIGRPWLTLAIDVSTRVVTGFYVSLEAPSATSVALCLSQAVLPKEAWLKQRGLDCSWPVWGLPRSVHADNGADFTSQALRRGCDEHGIGLILRPLGAPHYGGHIERLIGTMMGRVHMLPGTTGSNPADKGAYPSEAKAALTMAELERWLAIEICEHYHRRVHRGLHRSPLAAWEDALRNAGGGLGALPSHPEKFVTGFLPGTCRTLRRDGLHLFHIRYWDAALAAIARIGEVLEVRFDPRNLSRIFVTTRDGQHHPVPYADLGLPPITLWEHKAAVAQIRSGSTGPPDQASIFRAVLQQRELVETAVSRTRSARRERQRQQDAAIATRASPAPAPPRVDYSQPATPSDAELWDD